MWRADAGAVIIEFGGGNSTVCWDARSCSSPTIDESARSAHLGSGIRNHSDPRNPFASFTHIVLPHCTADLHLGAATWSESAESERLAFSGRINARTVLEWLYVNLASPSKIFVVGSGAGSFGAAMFADNIRLRYANTALQLILDGAVVALQTPHAAPQRLHTHWRLSERGVAALDPLFLVIVMLILNFSTVS